MSSSTGKLDTSTKSSNIVPVYIIGLIAMIGLMLVNFFLVADHSGKSAKYITKATELKVLSQRIAKNALESAADPAGDERKVEYGILECDGSRRRGIRASSASLAGNDGCCP